MHCPKCLSEFFHKDGFASGKQRYRCKGCDCRFTQARKRGYSFEKKLEALRLYKEGCGFRRIGRLIHVSNVTALNWIKAFGEEAKAHILSQSVDLEDMDVVVLDELWHYTQKTAQTMGMDCCIFANRAAPRLRNWFSRRQAAQDALAKIDRA
jgi:transposase-like protein